MIMFILIDGMYCRLDRHCVIVGIVLVGCFYYIVYVYYLNLGYSNVPTNININITVITSIHKIFGSVIIVQYCCIDQGNIFDTIIVI